MTRAAGLVSVLVCVLAMASVARAQEGDAGACADAFERGQVERRDGKLLAARRDFLFCAQAQCPTVLQQQCTALHDEVRQAVPSIVVSASDRAGRDVVDVRLRVDGAVAGQRLAGKPIELDPGEHELILERQGMEPAKQTVLLAEGQRAKLVRFNLPLGEAEAPRSSGGERDVPPGPSDDGPGLVIAGVGFGLAGAALIAGIVTGVLAMQAGEPCRDLDAQCDESYIADEQPLAHASTASFAVAGAGAVIGVVGLVLYATRPSTGAVELGFTARGTF